MKYTLILLSAVWLCTPPATAQTKTEYYSNGKKSFEGIYTYGWKEEMPEEYYNDTGSFFMPVPPGRTVRDIDMTANLRPVKIYQGVCTFYYKNGTRHFSGKYTNGLKDGSFTFWYPDGKKVASQQYVNGMANGKWTSWFPDGTIGFEGTYKAVSPAELDTIYNLLSDIVNKNNPAQDKKKASLARFLKREDSWREYNKGILQPHAVKMKQFFAHSETLFKRSFWNGPFIFYRNGRKECAFSYADNVPTGTWQLWNKEGELTFEVRFENGQAVFVKDYEPPAEDITVDRSFSMSDPDNVPAPGIPEEPAKGAGRATEAAKAPEVYTVVEQMPEFPDGVEALRAFIKKNNRYPEAAKKQGIQGRVFMRFIVMADGTIRDISVIRGLGYGCDEEAVRLVKMMPKWKPGRLGGKNVPVYYTLPVVFALKD